MTRAWVDSRFDEWAVDVVLPTHDRRSSLSRALDSIALQTVRPRRIIVVDDASTDGTVPWLRSRAFPRVEVIVLETRTGAGGARNAGISLATAEWVAFLDSDDVWQANHLEVARSLAEERSSIAVCSSCEVMSPLGRRDVVGMGDSRGVDILPVLLSGNRFTMITTVVRRSAAHEVGGFSTSMPTLEDWDFLIRLAARGRFSTTGRVTAFAQSSKSGVNAAATRRRIEAVQELMERHSLLYKRFPEAASIMHCWLAKAAVRDSDAVLARASALRAFRANPGWRAGSHVALACVPTFFRWLLRLRDRIRVDYWREGALKE